MMTDALPWFIATVWIEVDLPSLTVSGRPIVLRLQALDEADYRQRVRTYADAVHGQASSISLGPISRSKVQGERPS